MEKITLAVNINYCRLHIKIRALSSHRKDNEYFYATHTFYSFDDSTKQLKVHNYKYNKFPMRPLNWKAPVDYIKAFLQDDEIF